MARYGAAVVELSRRERMLPKKVGRPPIGERAKGDPRTFRPDLDVNEYIEKAQSLGLGVTETINRSLRLARDAGEELGDLWYEVERRAKVEGVDEGTIMGRLVKAALDAEQKKARK